MDRDEAEAIVRQHADAAIQQSTAELTPQERAELEASVASYREAKAQWLRDEQALVEDVQQRQQRWGNAWEQVLRSVADLEGEGTATIRWGQPHPRTAAGAEQAQADARKGKAK